MVDLVDPPGSGTGNPADSEGGGHARPSSGGESSEAVDERTEADTDQAQAFDPETVFEVGEAQAGESDDGPRDDHGVEDVAGPARERLHDRVGLSSEQPPDAGNEEGDERPDLQRMTAGDDDHGYPSLSDWAWLSNRVAFHMNSTPPTNDAR